MWRIDPFFVGLQTVIRMIRRWSWRTPCRTCRGREGRRRWCRGGAEAGRPCLAWVRPLLWAEDGGALRFRTGKDWSKPAKPGLRKRRRKDSDRGATGEAREGVGSEEGPAGPKAVCMARRSRSSNEGHGKPWSMGTKLSQEIQFILGRTREDPRWLELDPWRKRGSAIQLAS